jgi:hypothetical protein
MHHLPHLLVIMVIIITVVMIVSTFDVCVGEQLVHDNNNNNDNSVVDVKDKSDIDPQLVRMADPLTCQPLNDWVYKPLTYLY